MKFKITKAEYDALTDAMKVLYVVDGDGYKMPLVDVEDPGELRRARDREKEEAKVAKAALATAQAELDALKTEPARKTGDIAVLEASWKKKMDDAILERDTKIAAVTGQLNKTLIEHAATKITAAITDKPSNASLMLPHVTPRLEVVYDGDVPTVKIKDKTGRLSAMNFDEFQKELIAEPMFGTVVIGSKASGAGSSGQRSATTGGGAAKKFMDLPEAERVALFKENPAEYRRLKAADGQ